METTTKTSLIYVAIIVILIGGFLFWQKNDQVEIPSPEQITSKFFEDWIIYEGNPLTDKIYEGNELVTEEFVNEVNEIITNFEGGAYDPILCAQDKPSSFVVNVHEKIDENLVLIMVSSSYSDSIKEILVENRKIDEEWKINKIICSGVQQRDSNLTLIENYLDQNINELSTTEAVLGGTFYINEIEHIDDSNLIVSYEDGHIALQATVTYEINPEDGTVEIKSFEILEE